MSKTPLYLRVHALGLAPTVEAARSKIRAGQITVNGGIKFDEALPVTDGDAVENTRLDA